MGNCYSGIAGCDPDTGESDQGRAGQGPVKQMRVCSSLQWPLKLPWRALSGHPHPRHTELSPSKATIVGGCISRELPFPMGP